MKIEFDEDGGIIYALSHNVMYQGALHEELMWAEIVQFDEGFEIRFESDYLTPIVKPTLDEAKDHIRKNYKSYRAQSNGIKFEIDEDD